MLEPEFLKPQRRRFRLNIATDHLIQSPHSESLLEARWIELRNFFRDLLELIGILKPPVIPPSPEPDLPPEPEPYFPPPTPEIEGPEVTMHRLHDALRKEHGLPLVSPNKYLHLAATEHAKWMLSTGNLKHTGKGRSTPGDRVTDVGYKHISVGEIIAMGYSGFEVSDVLDMWYDSRGHRNIMLGNYGECGFGYAKHGNKIYWCGVFANPATKQGMQWMRRYRGVRITR